MTEKAYRYENHAITVRGLTKSFGETKAVRSVSFDVREGEVFSLLGVNGAGKTTTIRMLTGLLDADEGKAELFGNPAGSQEAKRVLGFSPQETSTAGNLTAEENLAFMAELYGMDSVKSRVKKLTAQLGLTEHARKRSKNLSGGLRRRLSIGMAIITEPRILFLDEPTLGLDVLARRELWRFLTDLKISRNLTILLTTHYMEEAEALSDRIGIMTNGTMQAIGTLDELRKTADLSADARLEDVFVKLSEGRCGA